MILFYTIFILIPLIANAGDELGPSYRSSVMEGDKPILRGGGPEEAEEDPVSEEEERAVSEVDTNSSQRDSNAANDLKLIVAWLVNNYGYEVVSHSRRQDPVPEPAEEPEVSSYGEKHRHKRYLRPERRSRHHSHRSKKKRLRGAEQRAAMYGFRRENDIVQEAPAAPVIQQQPAPGLPVLQNIPAGFNSQPVQRSSKTDGSSDKNEPPWKLELKDFMKDLISRVPRSKIERYTKPVVKAIEAKNKVSVADIDVDQFAHILVDYADLSNPKLKNKIIVDKGKRIIRDEDSKRSKKGKSKDKGSKSKHSYNKNFEEWSPASQE